LDQASTDYVIWRIARVGTARAAVVNAF